MAVHPPATLLASNATPSAGCRPIHALLMGKLAALIGVWGWQQVKTLWGLRKLIEINQHSTGNEFNLIKLSTCNSVVCIVHFLVT
jgi:hypothetical protein